MISRLRPNSERARASRSLPGPGLRPLPRVAAARTGKASSHPSGSPQTLRLRPSLPGLKAMAGPRRHATHRRIETPRPQTTFRLPVRRNREDFHACGPRGPGRVGRCSSAPRRGPSRHGYDIDGREGRLKVPFEATRKRAEKLPKNQPQHACDGASASLYEPDQRASGLDCGLGFGV